MPSRMPPFLNRFVQTNLLPDWISCTLCIPALFGIGVIQFLVQMPQAPWLLFPADTALLSTVCLFPFSHLVWSAQWITASWLKKHGKVLFLLSHCLNHPQMITHLFFHFYPFYLWGLAQTETLSLFLQAFETSLLVSQMSGWSSDILMNSSKAKNLKDALVYSIVTLNNQDCAVLLFLTYVVPFSKL